LFSLVLKPVSTLAHDFSADLNFVALGSMSPPCVGRYLDQNADELKTVVCARP